MTDETKITIEMTAGAFQELGEVAKNAKKWLEFYEDVSRFILIDDSNTMERRALSPTLDSVTFNNNIPHLVFDNDLKEVLEKHLL